MPHLDGAVGHHCCHPDCSFVSSNKNSPGFCPDHQKICEDPYNLHPTVKWFHMNWESCAACNKEEKRREDEARKQAEANEKARKKKELKESFTKMPPKERKPRHPKKDKDQDGDGDGAGAAAAGVV